MTEDQYKLAKYLWSRGTKVNDIARACRLTYSEVMNTACAHREDFPRRHGRTTIDADRLRLMRMLRDEGMKYQQIADAIGCHVNTVARHLRDYEVRYE